MEETHLNHISTARIEEFIRVRREAKVEAAPINRDLQFLAQILKQAKRERMLARSPFELGEFRQNESRERRTPHILTWEEQEKLLAVARPRIRILVVLGTETGMRTGEMLSLKWRDDVDFLNDAIRVQKAKTAAGARILPMSAFCKSELLRWRNLIGSESDFLFPSFKNKRHQLQGGRKGWANTLKEGERYVKHSQESRGGISRAAHRSACICFQRSGSQVSRSLAGHEGRFISSCIK